MRYKDLFEEVPDDLRNLTHEVLSAHGLKHYYSHVHGVLDSGSYLLHKTGEATIQAPGVHDDLEKIGWNHVSVTPKPDYANDVSHRYEHLHSDRPLLVRTITGDHYNGLEGYGQPYGQTHARYGLRMR